MQRLFLCRIELCKKGEQNIKSASSSYFTWKCIPDKECECIGAFLQRYVHHPRGLYRFQEGGPCKRDRERERERERERKREHKRDDNLRQNDKSWAFSFSIIVLICQSPFPSFLPLSTLSISFAEVLSFSSLVFVFLTLTRSRTHTGFKDLLTSLAYVVPFLARKRCHRK